jgi:hypothetical protein
MSKIIKYNEFINNDSLINDMCIEVENKCGHMSDLDRVATHPIYKEIIKIGKPAIPILLQRMRSSVYWFNALRSITNENIDQENRGYIDLMREDWLKWAKDNTA